MISNREARNAKRAAAAEKRRQEVERKRREREEQIKKEKEEQERQEKLRLELEEQRKRKEEERRFVSDFVSLFRSRVKYFFVQLTAIRNNQNKEKCYFISALLRHF